MQNHSPAREFFNVKLSFGRIKPNLTKLYAAENFVGTYPGDHKPVALTAETAKNN